MRWSEHRARRRVAFVQAAVAAVDEHGPGASAEQIADAAGVSRTVLYRYFRDREDLRSAIAEHIVRDVVGQVLPTLAIDERSTPRQVIVATIGVIIGWLDDHPNLYRFLRLRRDGSLDSVENTLAASVAALLKSVIMIFGIDDARAEPGAHGIVGFVEATGGWWLEHRTMSRERCIQIVSSGVWHFLEGTAREHGIEIGYDDPLPLGALTAAGAGRVADGEAAR
ncbi:TetR/AcrR family transcriptional regulator [uncultured Jatrophihabitans sp.]|uniref:TetR/AcrR family transcriptional regulator n=1 Tax=uncultured Jatrophihabitans sp. TaxID=1610747 RepID=UPI0035CA2504